MACVHLQELFQLCQENDLKVSGADLVHFVCEKCNRQEVCPMSMMEQQEEIVQLSPPTSETLAAETSTEKSSS
jgi:hypothetical protein